MNAPALSQCKSSCLRIKFNWWSLLSSYLNVIKLKRLMLQQDSWHVPGVWVSRFLNHVSASLTWLLNSKRPCRTWHLVWGLANICSLMALTVCVKNCCFKWGGWWKSTLTSSLKLVPFHETSSKVLQVGSQCCFGRDGIPIGAAKHFILMQHLKLTTSWGIGLFLFFQCKRLLKSCPKKLRLCKRGMDFQQKRTSWG